MREYLVSDRRYISSDGVEVLARADSGCGSRPAPGVITPIQPEVPEATIRESQESFQRVILGPERVPGVLKAALDWSPVPCRVRPSTRHRVR